MSVNTRFSPGNFLKIGIFDSGIGGLSIWQDIVNLISDVSTVYLADQKYAPYGIQPIAVIKQRATEITNYFQSQGILFVVVACNTATTTATINDLRLKFPQIQFIGVEPPVKSLKKLSKTKKTAIFATPATCQSRRLQTLVDKYASDISVEIVPTPEWAGLVESGAHLSSQIDTLLSKYLQPLMDKGVDTVGLGCTHYTFLLSKLEIITQHKIKFVDVSSAVARRVQTLTRANSKISKTNSSPHQFLTTASPVKMQLQIQNLLKRSVFVESTYI